MKQPSAASFQLWSDCMLYIHTYEVALRRTCYFQLFGNRIKMLGKQLNYDFNENNDACSKSSYYNGVGVVETLGLIEI